MKFGMNFALILLESKLKKGGLMKKTHYLLTATILLIFSSIAFADSFQNGSFEIGPDPGGYTTLYAGNTSITGWTVTQGSIDYIGLYWAASAGSRSIDLNGYYAQGGIGQSFDTTINQKYIVSLDLAGNFDQGPDPKTMTVYAAVDSGNYSFSQPFSWSHAAMGWETKYFEFTADATTTILRFISTTGATDNAWGPALDNVKVTPVPEPGILILLGISMASVVGLRRWWKD
jgi:choice-of-anchor C domain-containing protein